MSGVQRFRTFSKSEKKARCHVVEFIKRRLIRAQILLKSLELLQSRAEGQKVTENWSQKV